MNQVLILAGSGSCERATGAIPEGSEIASGKTLSRNRRSSRRTRDRRHRPEVAAEDRNRHQRVVGGAVQRAILTEPPPPLQPDGPCVPKNGAPE